MCTNACRWAACGDGIVWAGVEVCDDDNPDDGDGCFRCQVEAGWDCANNQCQSICGDRLVVGDEECDDGNQVTETCSYGEQACIVCAQDCTEEPGATSYCGDRAVDVVNGEDCDDGNFDESDGCLNDCREAAAANCVGVCDKAGTMRNAEIVTSKIVPDNGRVGDQFAMGIGVGPGVVLFGANGGANGGDDLGYVNVYNREATGWCLGSDSHRSDIAPGHFFGQAVQMNGDNAVISAHLNESAYIFSRNEAGIWTEIAKLRPPAVQNGSGFWSSPLISMARR